METSECTIYSKLTLKHQDDIIDFVSAFIVNFQQVSHTGLVFPLLPLSKYMPTAEETSNFFKMGSIIIVSRFFSEQFFLEHLRETFHVKTNWIFVEDIPLIRNNGEIMKYP